MVLSVENLGLSLGKKRGSIFRDVSFSLGEGETALLAGKAGSGKTVLGLALCGYLPLWAGNFKLSGRIECLGGQVEQGVNRPEAGILLENPYTQLSGLKGSVLQELAFPLECLGVPRAEMPAVIEQYSALLDIGRILNHPVRALSGGELQRVLVACTLLSHPRFLFLDRPLTEIDAGFRPILLNLFRSHADSVQGAVLLAEDPWLMPGETFKQTVHLGREMERHSELRLYQESGEPRKKPSDGLLRVEDVSFAYPRGDRVLDKLSFSVGEGDIVFVAGPNGSGKTTLARIITGVLAPSSGEIFYSGRPGKKMEQWEIVSLVGFAMQNPDLHLSRRTVGEEFVLGGEEFRPSPELVDILGLNRFLTAHPLELTQAEKKRLVMALALGGNRRIVILDEPSQYQDEDGFHRMTEAVSRSAAEGKTLLIITHDPRFYQAFPDAGEIAL
ncbi:MAG: ATP-binding cassette domain-containing protein [Candidatus Latescibacter sp.]|nr:ATP-binding cassette domain-containing protein [Candidatus Latescibacter sp.]